MAPNSAWRKEVTISPKSRTWALVCLFVLLARQKNLQDDRHRVMLELSKKKTQIVNLQTKFEKITLVGRPLSVSSPLGPRPRTEAVVAAAHEGSWQSMRKVPLVTWRWSAPICVLPGGCGLVCYSGWIAFASQASPKRERQNRAGMLFSVMSAEKAVGRRH